MHVRTYARRYEFSVHMLYTYVRTDEYPHCACFAFLRTVGTECVKYAADAGSTFVFLKNYVQNTKTLIWYTVEFMQSPASSPFTFFLT